MSRGGCKEAIHSDFSEVISLIDIANMSEFFTFKNAAVEMELTRPITIQSPFNLHSGLLENGSSAY